MASKARKQRRQIRRTIYVFLMKTIRRIIPRLVPKTVAGLEVRYSSFMKGSTQMTSAVSHLEGVDRVV